MASHNAKERTESHDGTLEHQRGWQAEPIDLLGRQLGELADRETRLLAAGIGEHYPHEILINVEQLRSERAWILALSTPA